jgi:glucoamylase
VSEAAGDDLAAWLEGQRARAASWLARAVSAVDLVHERPAFGQRIRPAPGSVLASPVSAHWDPEPDYFFHWIRDSAHVTEAMLLEAEAADGGPWRTRLAEVSAFGLAIARAAPVARVPREQVRADHRRFLRSARALQRTGPRALLGEVRFEADGRRDIQRWARPQTDGPALRGLVGLRLRASFERRGWDPPPALDRLLELDVEFVVRGWRGPSFDLWEEVKGVHYHTRLLQAALLGAVGHRDAGDALASLDRLWSPELSCLLARTGRAARPDTAVLLAVLHAGRTDGPHSLLDDRVHATLTTLEDRFAALYPINRARPADHAPLLGRYEADVYFGGNPWPVTTLAAAELHYRLAASLAAGAVLPETPRNLAFRERLERAGGAVARGDMFVRALRPLLPADGAMAEQQDRVTGAPVSARHLSWSYAALITAAAARARALTRQAPDAGSRTPARAAPAAPPGRT